LVRQGIISTITESEEFKLFVLSRDQLLKMLPLKTVLWRKACQFCSGGKGAAATQPLALIREGSLLFYHYYFVNGLFAY